METFQALQDKIKRNKRLQLNDLIVNGTIILNNIPTEDPQVKDQLWSNNGVLSVSTGEVVKAPVVEKVEEEIKSKAVKKSVKKSKETTTKTYTK